ncbi:hypothetical protein L228DRAFT_270601 [Xylona heveae TC161]|uniref:HECT-type E3 ubiquitin transferase n=1 Tax=Xylona heveae (strain CBS 132557 / TC161) TaxID=1328760 RepID=A0A165A1G5_XYLHT|nr:hypothetical protein L228DRAFT_270601 [Xylona heveae TC161]KZF19822.1 hypothetical protein L228DRAFT_270601 [Xylona heveae TC161]
MGKIKKAAGPKHEATLSPALSQFVNTSTKVPLCKLPSQLATFPRQWPFPRGDLYHWISLLNRFDRILELFTQEYALRAGPQTQPFSRRLLLRGDATEEDESKVEGTNDEELDKLGFGVEGDRELIESLLVFSRILLENCGNRSLYASSEYLNDLLNTTSLSLLSCTLRLTVRLAQRYHASRQRTVSSAQHLNQALLASHYNIDLDRVHKLALPFVKSLPPPPAGLSSSPSITPSKGKEKTNSTPSVRSTAVGPLHATDLTALARADSGRSSASTTPEARLARSSSYRGQPWEEWGGVWLSYYPSPIAAEDTQKNPTTPGPAAHPNTQAPSTPTPVRRTSGLGAHRTPKQNRPTGPDATPSTPAESSGSRAEEHRPGGAKVLEISSSRVSNSSLLDILKDVVPELPQDVHYDLLTRLRVARALMGGLETRREILAIRMLAITNLAYIHPESVFQQKILQQDSDEPRRLQLAYQLAELIHQPGNGASGVPRVLQTFALGTLEALTKHKSKAPDICAALSVNVNHGVLLYVIRKAIAELGQPDGTSDSPEDDEWRDALFSLLGALPTSAPRTGDALVSAGLLQILLEALVLRTTKAERNHPKILNFLDTFVYSIRDAFQVLANAKGLDIIADLSSYEVDHALRRAQEGEGMPVSYRNQLCDYEIPYVQQQILRWVFKFINHMMSHSGGNFDRLLRNLIDSPPLLTSLRTVLGNAKIYGSSVWSGALNILNNFIHNEPTSYAVIAEAGLSKTFLEAITQQTIDADKPKADDTQPARPGETPSAQEAATASREGTDETQTEGRTDQSTSGPQIKRRVKVIQARDGPLAQGIIPATDAIATIPQAFGAICLNSAGMQLFQASDALDKFFEIFESPEHVKCMDSEIDLPSILGSSFDELVRHHPALKPAIMTEVVVMVARVDFLCHTRAWSRGAGAKLWVENGSGQLEVAGGRKALFGDSGPFSKKEKEAYEIAKHMMSVGDQSRDVEMKDLEGSSAEGQSATLSPDDSKALELEDLSDKEEGKSDPTVSTYINVAVKFLSGFFSNASLCSGFIEMGGVEYVLDFATLPSLPYDFNNQAASQELARVIHMLVEQKPHLVLPSLIKRTQKAVEKLESFMDHQDPFSFFGSLTSKEGSFKVEQGKEHGNPLVENATRNAKSLVAIHTLTNILYEAFSPPMFNHRSSNTVFSQANLVDMYCELVHSLGRLHRACVREEILLQKSIPESWKEATKVKGFGMGNEDADDVLGFVSEDVPQNSTNNGNAASADSNSTGDRPASASGQPEGPEKDKKLELEQDQKTAPFKNVQTLRYLLSQIPSSITPFFQSLGKSLITKRGLDAYPKQNASLVADALAATSLAQLKFPALDKVPSLQDRYSYWIVILSSISQFMIEGGVERAQPQCLTLVLQSFKTQGGLEALNEILDVFFAELKALVPTAEKSALDKDASARLAAAYGGVKIILSFYSQIITSKYIIEASQTIAISSRERDKDKPDYFSPGQFLVELRMGVLPSVIAMWQSDFVDKSSSSIIKSLIDILRIVLEGENEQGAYKRSDRIPPRTKTALKSWKVNTDNVGKLTEKGFEESLVQEALFRCNNNLSMAQEYCVSQQSHFRVSRNPIPENADQERQQSQQQTLPVPTQESGSRLQGQQDDTQATMAPPVGPDGHSVLVENPQIEIDSAGGSSSRSRSAAPPPAPGIPLDDDSLEEHGSLAMSIDNILGLGGALGIPLSRDSDAGHGPSANAPEPPSQVQGTEAGKLPDVVTIDDLDEKRVAIRSNLIDRCLDVLNRHDDITFDLADLITAAAAKANNVATMRGEIGEILVQSLISLQSEEDYRPAGKKIAAYAHLLALVIQDREFYDATLDELKENFSTLMDFIKVTPEQTGAQSPWIGNILLILEKLLSEDVQPRQIKWTPPSADAPRAPSPVAELDEPMVQANDKERLFEALIEILPRIGKEESLALSVVRVLVILTRNHNLASRLGNKRNMQRLFVMIKQLAGNTSDKLQSAFFLILRHVIEDDETIKQIMRSEIQAMFHTRQQRQTDTTTYTRQMYHLVVRSPELFVEVTNEKLKLLRFDSGQRPQVLVLKKDENGSGDGEASSKPKQDNTEQRETEISEASDKQKPSEVKAPVVEHPDGVIHYLLCELLSYKDVDDKEAASSQESANKDASRSGQPDVEMTVSDSPSPTPPPSSSQQQGEVPRSEKPEFKADQHPIYIYRCFILQCLTELLSCYNRTKVEFINFSRKTDPQAATPSKPRSGVLNYLLNAVIPVGTLNHTEDIAFRKKQATSSWAISAIVALCFKTGEREFYKGRDISDGEEEPDLLFVRKFVLEHALKAYKDACASNEALDVKYTRLMNLSDLFNRMLTGRPNSGSNTVGTDLLIASQKQLARIMFEKNFIAVLTSSIADVDLNFPNSKRAVKYILRPLKLLTQTAIDLSVTSSLSTTPGQTDDDEISTATSVSDNEEGREETPDLFRNSTLGMLEPGREEESSSEGSQDDEDMYEDEYDDEMEYDEEMPDDDEDVVSDEDEDIEGMGQMEGLPGDVGMDVEVVIDDDEEGDDDESDEDEEGSEDMDEGEDLEVVDDMGEEIDEDESLDEGDDDEWQSEDEEDDYDDEEPPIGMHGDEHDLHNGPIGHIVRALEDDGDPTALEHLDGDPLDMNIDPDRYMEDDLGEDEDDEEDEEDIDDEDMVYEPDFDDEDVGFSNMPWGWEADEPGLLTRGHHHRHHHHRALSPWSIFPSGGPGDRGMLIPTYRSHRPAGVRGADDGTNPLLQRVGDTGAGAGAGRPSRPEPMSDWVHAIDPVHPSRGIFTSESPVSLINNLMTALGQAGGPGLGALQSHGGALHFHIAGGPNGALPRDLQSMLGLRRPQPETSRPSRDDPAQAVTFMPTVTTVRWQEEARLLFGASYIEKAQRIINSLLRVMVPPAIEEEKIRKEKALEEARKLKEREEKKAEEERIAKEKAEQEEKEKREKEEREAAEAAALARASGQAEEASAPTAEQTNDSHAMEGVEPTQAETAAIEEAGVPAPRIHTTIRGQEVDITDMHIDPEYLEALPEDIREEVIMHQLAEQRSQAAAAGEEPTDISREFLDALPADIREELLQQEAQDRRRREREEARRRAAANGGAVARAEDMDPASFLASLDPNLRQAVLMDQDDEVLAQLPEAIAAEARALGGDRRLHQFMDMPRINRAHVLDSGDNAADEANRKQQRKQVVQMLDKSGVATLLRLMFIPLQGSARHTLNGILQNVCENRQNRAEVISMILHILQDGSVDISAVERSFAHLSIRAKNASSQKTPQPLKRTLTGQQFAGHNSEMSPLMVVQQCLNSLVFLTQYNPHVPSFFLTEHDGSSSAKNRQNKKGKAKEGKASKFALNALLGLLDRKMIMENATVMEHLSSLLNSITHPLVMLLKKDQKDKPEEAAEETQGEENPEPTADTSVENQAVVREEGNVVPESTSAPEESNAPTEAAPGATSLPDDKAVKDEGTKPKKPRTLTPPAVPEGNLRLVVNILSARECSAKTFRETLSTINNLSALPEARDIFGRELIAQAQGLGHSILKDLDDLVPHIQQAETGTEVQGMALAKFSPASSDQAKLLRVLTALDYLFDPKRTDTKEKSDKEIEVEASEAKADILTALYENPTFGLLWNKLSDCLIAIRQRDNLLNVATILLPLVEALMVVCKNTTLKDVPLARTEQKEFGFSSPEPESPMEQLFFNFTEEHRKILNDLVRHNPKLMSGTFSLLVKNPKVLEFDNKRNYFTRRLHSRGAERHAQPPLQLQVRRDQVFLDSFKSLYFKTGEEMKYGKLNIRFHREEGVDAGGVTREWFQVLSRQMFNPDYALFTPVAADRTTFHPNRLSSVNQEHLMFFKFIGRIIGKALYEGRVLDCHFSRAVYKRILGKPVSIKDMETLDLDYYKSLVWMLENDITDIITETFSVETDAFGESQTIDLIENGRNIPVTEENKHEYVRLVVEYRMTGSVREQLEHFLKGFHDIVPAELISIFNEQELELLISGLPDIDVDDWKNNTEYHNYSASSPQIQWFWRAVRSFDKEERAKLLQFVTGTSKVPLNGFKELEGMNGFSRFNIHRDYGSKDRLPSSHTCFNQLDLPEYESYEALRKQLYKAMTVGSSYFGFA